KQTRWTYSEIANRSINGTLVRSINTTVVALLPVAGLLFIGGGVLGAGMLNDISLSLFVGLAAGAYSSIFIATPLVADLKEREPQIKALKKRILAKRAAAAAKGESAEDERDDLTDDLTEPAGAVVGQRRQPGGHGRTPRNRR
ncbi:protein translocase subunit SecF, partial [[Kitasatospora] papulosa]